jgi:putative ABC transport system permease protein
MTAFRGNASWAGYDMISGHWYSGPGQVDVPTNFLTVTGKAIGDTVTFSAGGAQVTARIVGEVFDTDNRGLVMLTGWRTLAAADRGLTAYTYDVALRPGTSANAYIHALGSALGRNAYVSINGRDPFILTLIGLIGTLTLLLAVVAGLGVLNTVVVHTRERAHDLGIFKAVGMTPRQTIAMVVCWVAGTGLVAGLLAVPAGIAVHRHVLPVMAHAAGTGIPASYLAVYRPWEIALLAVAGLIIAAAGGMMPAVWAARTRTVAALRAE